MPLAKAQFMEPPGGPGILGAIKAGDNIIISPDGTISSTGGEGGGSVTNVSGVAPISVQNGTTTPVISFDSSTTSLTGYVKVAGDTMTGRLQLIPGAVDNASLGFTGSSLGTGLYSPKPNYIGMTTTNNNTGFWLNTGGQIMAGRPEAVPDNYSLGGTTYQGWSDDFTAEGQKNPGVATFYIGNDNQFVGRLRMCRGEGSIDNIQTVESGDEIGNVIWCESTPGNPTGIPRAQISCYQAQDTNEATRLVFWNTLDSDTAYAQRWFLGGGGNFVPWTNNADDIGNPGQKVHDIYLQNSPIVGQSPYFSVGALQDELGLAYVNSLEPVSYVNAVERNVVNGTWLEEPNENNWDGKVGPLQVTPVQGSTTHWGFVPSTVVSLNESLGYTGQLGVAGYNNSEGGLEDLPFIRNEELIAPVVLAIQQLSAQLDELRAEYDAYVAAHP